MTFVIRPILRNPPATEIVAGGFSSFKSGILAPPIELNSNIKGIAEYVYQKAEENTSFLYVVSCGAILQATGYLSSRKKYGVITITCYLKERSGTFDILDGVIADI